MKHHLDTTKPPKFLDLTGDDCCPHQDGQEPTVKLRIFCNAIKYKGCCYSTCDCGNIILEVDRYQAHHWVNANFAEYAKADAVVSTPGHECCDEKDMTAVITPPPEAIVKPVITKPDVSPVVKPAAPVVNATVSGQIPAAPVVKQAMQNGSDSSK